jgi:hypothetical protein
VSAIRGEDVRLEQGADLVAFALFDGGQTGEAFSGMVLPR